jgi:preprotein translocase subunit SecD
MHGCTCRLGAVLFFGCCAAAGAQEQTPTAPAKLPNGVYAVLRDSLVEKDLLPLKDGETAIAHDHRYLVQGDREPPRFLVVRSSADVDLDLDGAPNAEQEGNTVVRILLKLQPKAAAALERLTSDQLGQQVAVIVGGDVVTTHKVREVIRRGEVQITSCAAGAADYLLKHLQAHHAKSRSHTVPPN